MDKKDFFNMKFYDLSFLIVKSESEIHFLHGLNGGNKI